MTMAIAEVIYKLKEASLSRYLTIFLTNGLLYCTACRGLSVLRLHSLQEIY